MKMVFVGTGAAFCMKNYQCNTLIEHNGKRLLIDAGNDIRFALDDVGFGYGDIDALYISHLHADHVAGVEWLAFGTFFDPSIKNKIEIMGKKEVIEGLWNSCLGGLRYTQEKEEEMVLEDYFDVFKLDQGDIFVWEGLQFELKKNPHVQRKNSNRSEDFMWSYGLMITTLQGTKVYYSGDTMFTPESRSEDYEMADFIIHDCETAPYDSGVHPSYNQLVSLPDSIKSKMLLQHYQDNILDDDGEILDEWYDKAEDDGFMGFTIKGRSLVFP